MKLTTPTLYFSYLVRLWLAGDGDQPQWRASLEEPSSGERLGFNSPEELFAYLRQRMRTSSAGKPPAGAQREPP